MRTVARVVESTSGGRGIGGVNPVPGVGEMAFVGVGVGIGPGGGRAEGEIRGLEDLREDTEGGRS